MLQVLRRPRSDESDHPSAFSDRSSEISDAMRILRLAAEPRPAGDSTKAAILRAAKRFGWSYERTRHMWHGDARRVEVGEMDQLRAFEQERDQAAIRAEQRHHLQQLHALRAKLQFNDPDFHAADIAAISWLLEHHQ